MSILANGSNSGLRKVLFDILCYPNMNAVRNCTYDGWFTYVSDKMIPGMKNLMKKK
jgi:hypothetical protein